MSAQITESPAVRFDATTDRPAGLSKEETRAYVSGYSKACTAYARKHGIPSVSTLSTGDDEAALDRDAHAARVAALDVPALHALTRAYEGERHPAAHRAGNAALTRYRKRYGITATVVPAVPAVPARAPHKARKLAAVPDVPAPVVAAPRKARKAPVPVPVVPVSDVTMPTTYAERKAWRRELAATMRAAGIDPRGQAWEDATAALRTMRSWPVA